MGQSLQQGYHLFITNGDSAGELLRKGFASTEVLPWRDVLHDGPVPMTETLEELSEVRADFLADRGWGDRDVLRENFLARDRGLSHHETFESVTLWFEHDLYDQLQLIQILSWFADNPRDGDALSLMQSDDFLGTQTPEKLTEMAGHARLVTEEQTQLAKQAWEAFRQSEPNAWAYLLKQNTSALPYLEVSVKRMLQELPDVTSGLSRTQHQILVAINEGIETPKRLFGAVEKLEESAFMGDWSFWTWLDDLATGKNALVEPLNFRFSPKLSEDEFAAYTDSALKLTTAGLQVLAGNADYCAKASIDRWMGGTHITNDNLWRWDDKAGEIIAPV